ncbi:MAG: DNA recombination protein RmuC [Pseudomonadota bacterium]
MAGAIYRFGELFAQRFTYADLADVTSIDEEMAEVTALLARGPVSMAGNGLVLAIVGIAIMLLVLVTLAVVIGRIRRQRDEFAEGEDIFDQRFDTNGYGPDEDPFATNDVFAQDDAFADDYGDEGDDPFPADRLDLPTDPPAEPPREAPIAERVTERIQPIEAPKVPEPAPQNVVPLRSPEQQGQPMVQSQPMERFEEPMRRDAAMQMASSGDSGGDYDYGAAAQAGGGDNNTYGGGDHGGSDWSRSYDERPKASGQSYDDDEAPFVAPFIRDYIEESERRQTSRLDDIREEMRRQLTSVREEQSSRLDLFLNSIDRKLGQQGPSRADLEENASTRRRIDGLSGTIDSMSQAVERHGERLGSLSRAMEERLAEVSPIRGELRSVHDDVLSFRRDVEANTLAIGQIRQDLEVMKEDFGRMERSFLERAEADHGITMRLSDVVRGTLSEDDFKLNARLSNGHTADALILLAGGRSIVAVDSRFPIESFNALPSRDAVRRNLKHAKAAEDDFRRQVLRAIFACADRCIVEGETTDSAILFLPSEASYTILHDRFPDLVRDSHRARVWLTSPSTLMGTLALLQNVFEKEPLEEQLPPRQDYHDDEGPYYAGPDDRDGYQSADDRREPQRDRGRTYDDRSYDERYEDHRDDHYDDRYKDHHDDDHYDDRDEADALEERLRALRDEERALADELERRRQAPRRAAPQPSTAPSRRYKSAPCRPEPEDDFETRLERFSLDIDEGPDYTMDDTPPPRSFRRDRDDDLR